VHAINNEMAWTLSDVVFRRTDLATGGYPGDSAIRACAEMMAGRLGWDEQEIRKQINSVVQRFPSWK
jgi:glycerol-3-phosphate dehydrogenase